MAREQFQPAEVIPYYTAVILIKDRIGGNLPRADDLLAHRYLLDCPPNNHRGAHGDDHVGGVLLNGRLLGPMIENQGINIKQPAVDLFALEHDRHRHNDHVDLWHGIRAAKDMLTRLHGVEPEILYPAAQIVRWHVWPQLAPLSLRRTIEWKVAISADSLEWTRDGADHEFGNFNPKHLLLPQAEVMIDLVRHMAARRKQIKEKQKIDGFTAAVMVGQELGLVQ